MIFLLVVTLTVGVIEKPMPNELVCAQAQFGAMAAAAAIPGAKVISIKCKREQT